MDCMLVQAVLVPILGGTWQSMSPFFRISDPHLLTIMILMTLQWLSTSKASNQQKSISGQRLHSDIFQFHLPFGMQFLLCWGLYTSMRADNDASFKYKLYPISLTSSVEYRCIEKSWGSLLLRQAFHCVLISSRSSTVRAVLRILSTKIDFLRWFEMVQF